MQAKTALLSAAIVAALTLLASQSETLSGSAHRQLQAAGQSLVRKYDSLFFELQLDDRFIGESEFWDAIVEPDANLEQAAADIVRSKTTNCGQLCTAVERVYVHEEVAPKLIALLRNRKRERQWGDRSQHHDWMGPLIHDNARLHIHQMVERAIDDGAVLECGGAIPAGKGFFYPPTLLTGCRQDMEIIQEETFGPVLGVVTYRTLDDALEMANDHQFGLASMIYSENHRTIMRVANEIEAGECYVNRVPDDPYQGHHGGWKRSGIGGDDGQHGMLAFTQTRLVVVPY